MGGIPTNYKAEVLTLNGVENSSGLMAIGEAAYQFMAQPIGF